MEGTEGTPAGRDGVDRWWRRFFRHGPHALLGLGTALSAASSEALMTTGDRWAAVPLLAAAVALQRWWWRTSDDPAAPSPAGRLYYALRTGLAFALSWLNPFFAIYGLIGYFDGAHILSGRWLWVGFGATAVTMAGSQSGGLPPQEATQWVVFGALFALHVSLTTIFGTLGLREEERSRAKAATIEALGRANARLEQALAENAGLHAQLLVQAREAGVQDERNRLAAEIHDTIAQGLAGVVTQLQAAQDTPDRDAARAHVARAAALARESLGEARRSVRDLGPAALEHDALPEALRKIAAVSARAAGTPVEFTVTGAVEPLHDEIEATLLRIAQEALANAGRHAGASRIGVTLSYMEDEVTLDVRDDGRGFDVAALPQRAGGGGGFGLGGMRARAERVAGSVDVESEPGQGTAVSARLPVVPVAAGARHG
ncbi:sensor histidine kinase [Streptomyces radicis]|uniref:Oxygen sensor histidine kinase NreB n=1 Tax=Streptomyces radicis TaxID=1750517 RepID=A0A3A9W8N8_9ACTN|nr:sensor histidine kinase [Streptomyces radicis]RKN05734.1 sensor histidine kinase [Streptomyces radicis]RKN17573.1 sensor histidine kinase [Streptomyces radicis]